MEAYTRAARGCAYLCLTCILCGGWHLVGVIGALVVLIAIVVAVVLWRRASESRWVAASAIQARISQPAPAPPPTPSLPPRRIVLSTSEVPVVELSRARGAPGDALDAPVLAGMLAPVARACTALMPLDGATRCRVELRLEVARAMHAGILPLLLAKSPVAPVVGEGIETIETESGGLAALAITAWQAAGAERARRYLAGLESRLSLASGGGPHDSLAALRARRVDLVELAGEILQGVASPDAARRRLDEVEDSCRARHDGLHRQLSSLPAAGDAMVLRQIAGGLLLMIALRATAVEVRALVLDNPDFALSALVELETQVARAAGIVAANRPGREDAVAEVLAFVKELEAALRAIRDRLFARELVLLVEVGPEGAVGGLSLA